MYKNIDEKLKFLAIILCLFGILIFIIIGIELIRDGDGLLGFGTIILGSLLSWSFSWILYGFGELVENTDFNRYLLCNIDKKLEKLEKHLVPISERSTASDPKTENPV